MKFKKRIPVELGSHCAHLPVIIAYHWRRRLSMKKEHLIILQWEEQPTKPRKIYQ
jgi:hypothetical protein